MKGVWMEHIVDALRELSDIEKQRALWLSDGSTEWSSFEEAVCGLFDDSAFDYCLKRGGTGLDPEVERQIIDLGKQLDGIRANRAPAKIINDPAMVEVRASASKILKVLRA